MTVTSALATSPESIARLSWPEARVFLDERGNLWYRRYPTSFGWEWKPSAADLVAEDYISFGEYAR